MMRNLTRPQEIRNRPQYSHRRVLADNGDLDDEAADTDGVNHSAQVCGDPHDGGRDLRGDTRDVFLCIREPVPREAGLPGDRNSGLLYGNCHDVDVSHEAASGARAPPQCNAYRTHALVRSGVCNILVLPGIRPMRVEPQAVKMRRHRRDREGDRA